MLNVSQASAASPASLETSATSTNSSAAAADYDAFLTLLVAQLDNQDPTNPTDSGEYLAQLASFSSVEQQIQTNEKLNALIQSNLLGQATSAIGHTITSADGTQSGIVVSAELTKGGLVAKLNDGSTITIENGVIVE